jgi:formate/nitrite transporter FocA (FNT family)
MKSTSSLNQIVISALMAGAVIGVATVAFNYQGKVHFNLGPNGFSLDMGGSSPKR